MNYGVDPERMAPKRKAKKSSFLWSFTVFLVFALAALIAFAVYLKNSRDELPLPAPSKKVEPPQPDYINSILKKDAINMNKEPNEEILQPNNSKETKELPKEELSIEPNPRIEDFINRLKTETDEKKLLAYVELYHKDKVDFNKLYEDKTKYKGSAFHFVAKDLMVEVLKKMHDLQSIEVDVFDSDEFSVLHAIAAYSEPKNETEFQRAKETIKFLIEETAFEIDLLIEEVDTPLITAIWNGKSEIAKILLELGASPHPTYEPFNKSPLIVAVKRNNVEIVKLLLKCGADPLKLDAHNYTPFHLAADLGHTDIMRIFLRDRKLKLARTGIDPNPENQSEWTALHFAASSNRYEAVSMLLFDYAIDDVPDGQGDFARQLTNDPKILALFENTAEKRSEYLRGLYKKTVDASIDRRLEEEGRIDAERKAAKDSEILASF